jgi:hypothetical protein
MPPGRRLQSCRTGRCVSRPTTVGIVSCGRNRIIKHRARTRKAVCGAGRVAGPGWAMPSARQGLPGRRMVSIARIENRDDDAGVEDRQRHSRRSSSSSSGANAPVKAPARE